MYLPTIYGNLDLGPGPRVYNLHRASQIIPPTLGTLYFSKLLRDVTSTRKWAIINIRSFSMDSKSKTVLHLSTD